MSLIDLVVLELRAQMSVKLEKYLQQFPFLSLSQPH